MIRITGGRFKGRRLLVPGGKKVRPTTERVRESIFSIIGDRVQGARVLDVFAGTGVLGLEALSRGAVHAVFIERNPRVFSVLKQNIALCNAEKESEVYCLDWLKGVKKLFERGLAFDLIFADPPYDLHLGRRFFENVRELSHPETIVVFERSAGRSIEFEEDKWKLIRVRKYGETVIDFFGPL
ncbi:16S rRNA (guanine(966)-N(2))-methyltransferase RsmD [Thermodesulforhabdus norvegica]|uniref:16S rRNA (Guanine(966)-N(2))-methyltransferase RsmD n=1 Tax=Thermodesulforhabdus norvegica TaxID=39841 RepID=A0A1I4RJJ9_9BACT|nr:16S rRNA (guanine(966)-N(2))-methyltransferase RsmD [Thermodesulforhabdus norvegica]SFM52427.1 16S rRNA (guanine(966)-N(2))-methyltransferase RsmD [Thermodesulforhabdus norvegica]